ncbi:MAG: 6-hydroxymethylpterin diphosphokinase MptE-like protein [Candidatus Jordarchaeales archaeon]
MKATLRVTYEDWEKWYLKIVKDFNFSAEKDREATEKLASLLEGRDVESALNMLASALSNRCVIVYGCGPSLERNIREIKRVGLEKVCLNVAADGATTALLNEGILPDLIVTDLDGRLKDILYASSKGSVVAVHAHGDNIHLLENVKDFEGPVIGTTQVKPIGCVRNFFGFTDGDRAAFISEAMGSHTILLAGFDFGDKVSRFSKPEYKTDICASPLKRKKLKYAKLLLEWLAQNTDALLINITGSGEIIKGVKNLKWIYKPVKQSLF